VSRDPGKHLQRLNFLAGGACLQWQLIVDAAGLDTISFAHATLSTVLEETSA
jgi:hypothetical protein